MAQSEDNNSSTQACEVWDSLLLPVRWWMNTSLLKEHMSLSTFLVVFADEAQDFHQVVANPIC